jgi:hypothetical protein
VSTDIDVVLERQVAKAIRVTYAKLTPSRGETLPPLASVLAPGAIFRRGYRGTLAEFVLGDVSVDPQLRVIGARVGSTLRIAREESVYDPYENTFATEGVPSETHLSAAFAIDLDRGWVILEDVGDALPLGTLIELIADYINDTVEDKEWVTSTLLTVPEDPYRFARRVDRVTTVSFSVTPSNPGKRWKDYDDILKDARAKKLSTRFENPDGLAAPTERQAPEEAGPIALGLAMTEAGYGDKSALQLQGDYQGRIAAYDGDTGWSTLYEEIDADAAEEARRASGGVVLALMGLVHSAAQSGLLDSWTFGAGDLPA